jgi:pilus assembly protein CpaB
MNRNTRTLIVLLVATVAAGVASYFVYVAIKRMPVREVEVAHTFVVAASHPLPAGALLTPADVKLVAWPERALLPGSFGKVEDVVNRGIVTPVLENEPFAEAKLAPVGAGAGLPPTITPGMRAISVRVNEVVGVAGFVTPGTHVDVFVTLKQGEGSITRVVVSNVQVLTAGTRYDQDKSKAGEAIPSSVVTLLVTPEDAERVVLASTDGQIMLALRNPLDVSPTNTSGTRTGNLFGGEAPSAESVRQVARPKIVVAPPPPPPVAPPPPPPYRVEAIRGAKRTEETLSSKTEDRTP